MLTALVLALAASMMLSVPASAESEEAEPRGPESVIRAVKADLSEREGVRPGEIDVLRVDGVTWRNGCMGVSRPGVYCTMALVPGYAVWVAIDDAAWRYHTNSTGSAVIQAAGPLPAKRVPYEPAPPGTLSGHLAIR